MHPLLVHIGYHKTASSWLLHLFYADPSTGFRALDKKARDAPVHRIVRDRPLEWDAASVREEFDPLFAEAREAGLVPVVCFARLAGQAMSGGYDSKMIADRLREVLPEAGIVMVIREQRRMLVSAYKQYVSAGGSCTLEHYLEPTSEDYRVPRFDYRFYEYDHLIAHYQTLYGKDSVLVLPYERFVSDPRGFVSALAGFAGLTLGEELLDRIPFDRRSTAAKSALWTAVMRPLNPFGARNDLNPEPLLGGTSVVAALGRRLRGRNSPLNNPRLSGLVARKEEELKARVAEHVGDRYVASNRRAAELTGLDLAEFGWMV